MANCVKIKFKDGLLMNLTLIYNSTAGFDKPGKEELIDLLTEKGFEVKFVNSDENNLDKKLENPGELVVVAGGDGTIAKVARRLIGREIPIGIFSMGTANNIAITFDACGSPRQQISSWNLSKLRPFNIGIIKGSWGEDHFFESSGFGLLPALVKQTKKKQKAEDVSFATRKEKIDYSLQILKDIIYQLPVEHYEIELDGQDVSGYYFLVEIMNIKSIGPHLFLAPDASPGDDLLDIVLMTEGEKELLLQFVKKRLKGEKAVLDTYIRQASEVKVITAKNKIHVDDEIEEAKGEIIVKIDPRKLWVV